MRRRTQSRLARIALALAFVLAGLVHSPNADAAPNPVAELLSQPKYRFCNDPQYRLFKEQKDAFCSTALESETVCPGLVAACKRPAWEEEQEEQEESASSFRPPEFLAPLFQLLFWTALTLGLAFILWSAWKTASAQTLDFSSAPKSRPVAPVAPLETAHALGHSRDALLRFAEQAAASGKYKEALLYLYQATLQGLSDQGWVRLRKSATSGDYSRTMRARIQGSEKGDIGSKETVEHAISHLCLLERERFTERAQHTETLDLIKRTQGLFQRWGSALVILLAWFAQGCDPDGLVEMPNDSTSPGGTLLFEELVGQRAASSLRRFRRLESLDSDTTAVIFMGGELEPLEWEKLDSWVFEGGELIVVGSPSGFANAFDVKVSTKVCDEELITAETRVSQNARWLAFDAQEGDESYLLCGESPVILGLARGEGWLTMIATRELIQNARLAEADHAQLIFDSILIDDARVELLGPWTGRGSSSPLQSMIKGGFGWWVLHILLFFAIAAWGLGRRFGRPSDPPEVRRRTFREHALALANQYQKAGAHSFVLQRFAEWTAERLRLSGPSGAKTRQALHREFATVLSGSESESSTHEPNSSPPSDSEAPTQLSIYRKLRGVLGRRSASPSSGKKKA